MFIDTHAHLNYPDIVKNLDEILARASAEGVEAVLIPATNYKTSLEVAELVQKHAMLYGAVGIHPNDLNDFEEKHLNGIEELTRENKISAIGEIGLDYYREPYDKDLQQYILKAQLQIARQRGLPVILHNRKSSKDLINIVTNEYDNGKLKGQFHSFSGDAGMAKKCVEMGFYISFTGNITYKPNENTLIAYEIVKNTDVKHLLLETDSPYLPPVPYRGRQNEPSYLRYTAEKIAELKGISVDELGKMTTENAKKLYKIK